MTEFLPTLQQRNKWAKPQRDLNVPKIGGLVLIDEKNDLPFHYPLGWITEAYKRDDAVV